jgi:hypothetical protein
MRIRWWPAGRAHRVLNSKFTEKRNASFIAASDINRVWYGSTTTITNLHTHECHSPVKRVLIYFVKDFSFYVIKTKLSKKNEKKSRLPMDVNFDTLVLRFFLVLCPR